MAKFLRHLFICTHDRGADGTRASCAQRGSIDVANALKRKAYDLGLKRIVRVNKSGCLDQCGRGAAAVVYPEGTWYGGLTLGDVDELVEEQLVAGRAVERLVIPDDQLTGLDPQAKGGESFPAGAANPDDPNQADSNS